jgi:hypothetical protein
MTCQTMGLKRLIISPTWNSFCVSSYASMCAVVKSSRMNLSKSSMLMSGVPPLVSANADAPGGYSFPTRLLSIATAVCGRPFGFVPR